MPENNNKLFILNAADRRKSIEKIIETSCPNRDFFLMIAASSVIATLGILIDNLVVVVGGMLVAPILSPILALALGIEMGDFRLIRRTLWAILKAIVVGVILALVISLFMPLDLENNQVLTKMTPSLAFGAIALVSLSMWLVEKARESAGSAGRKLMVLLSFMGSDVVNACHGRPRFDQPFVDYLIERDFLFVDSLQKHVDDFSQFRCTPEEYAARHYVGRYGHYAPAGNHFFAFAIKDEVIDWLDPKPPTYRFDKPPRPGELG